VYWGLGSKRIRFTGDREDFKQAVKANFKAAGNFELKPGRDDGEHDFEYTKNEECHIVEVVMGMLPPLEEWIPSVASTDTPLGLDGIFEPPPQVPTSGPEEHQGEESISSVGPKEDETPTPTTGSERASESSVISGTPGQMVHVTRFSDKWVDIGQVPAMMNLLRSLAEMGTVHINHQGRQWLGGATKPMDHVEIEGRGRSGARHDENDEEEDQKTTWSF
jgi:hypothetical protein